jgi:hypothetical protein
MLSQNPRNVPTDPDADSAPTLSMKKEKEDVRLHFWPWVSTGVWFDFNFNKREVVVPVQTIKNWSGSHCAVASVRVKTEMIFVYKLGCVLNKFNFPFYIICHFCLICIIVFYQFFFPSSFYVCGTFIKIGKDDSCTILMEFYVLYLWSFMYYIYGVLCTRSMEWYVHCRS